MAVNAGKFRHLVTVQRLTGTADTAGQEIRTYTTLAVTWAWIEPYVGSARAGREEFSGNQLIGLDYTRIHLRWDTRLATLSPKDQILYVDALHPNGRVFDIQAVNNRDERNF
ncbi:MAG TPA: head-tail adaptor protein, partial [Candidatus Dormibacteraeota bacterium]|nr:head-tail adaptor protein [Candidatus Dormibacteraeota bacterium]